MTREAEIIAILGRYRVQKHYRATKEAGRARYAVFRANAEQVSEPTTHSEAQAEAHRLAAADILALWQ